MNEYFGGDIMSDPFACRYCNDGNLGSIPPANQWTRGYANTSTEDYFSESFSHVIYPNQQGSSAGMPSGAQDWLSNQIIYETLDILAPSGVWN